MGGQSDAREGTIDGIMLISLALVWPSLVFFKVKDPSTAHTLIESLEVVALAFFGASTAFAVAVGLGLELAAAFTAGIFTVVIHGLHDTLQGS